MRVIVTRPLREAQLWVHDLALAGIEAVSLPLIDIQPVPDSQVLQQRWLQIANYVGVMFVSGNAVAYFFAAMPESCTAFANGTTIKTRAWATGPGTVFALLGAGVGESLIDSPAEDAAQFDSEALWQVVGPSLKAGDSVLIVRGSQAGAQCQGLSAGVGRDWFADQVQGAGAHVDFAVAYQRAVPKLSSAAVNALTLSEPQKTVWLLSSSEALANLRLCCPQQSWSKAKAIVTHARIGELARAAGFGVVCESRPTLPAIIASIESLK